MGINHGEWGQNRCDMMNDIIWVMVWEICKPMWGVNKSWENKIEFV